MGDREDVPPKGGRIPSGSLKRKVHLDSPAGEASPVINPRPAEIDDRQIGRYQVVGEITHGSKSVILKARDRDLGRDVAMKVLKKEHLKDPDAVQRFVEESQVGAQLQHPGIIPVYELGLVSDDRPYFTMKFVRGETLAILLGMRETPQTDQRKYLGIFEKVCHAIAYAHTRNVVHRDLRPWNVMVGDYGDVVVMDWGFAKVGALSGEPAMSRTATDSQISIIETIRQSEQEPDLVGVTIGTPGYMSPEQASGDIDRMDERSDVFALGAILCEILTGAAPYRGERVEEILNRAMFADQKDALKRLGRCDADKRLIDLAKSCMTPARDARPRNADEVASSLGRILTRQEAEAREAQVAAEEEKVRARGAARARRLTLAIAGVVLLAGILAAGLFFWLDRMDRQDAETGRKRVLAALGAAADHRREAEAKPAGRPERWAEAIASANAVRDLADSSPVDDALRARARKLAEEVARAEAADRVAAAAKERRERLVADLTRVREMSWEEPGVGDVPGSYEQVFGNLEITLGESSPKEAAAALGALGATEEIVGALDDWSRELADRDAAPAANRPLEVVRILDQDPMRNRIRAAVAGSSGGKRRGALLALESQLGEGLAPATELLLGISLLRSGAPEAAVRPLRRAAAGDPRSFWAQFELGVALLERASPDLTESIGRLSTAIALRPVSTGARHGLARALHEQGAVREAAAVLRDLLKAEPGSGHLTAHLGENLPSDEGFKLLENAATSTPDDPWVRHRLGVALIQRREWGRASREFAAAIRIAPDWRNAHRHWIKALAGAGELETVRSRYAEAAQSASDPDSWLLLGECLTAMGRPGDAIPSLERAVEIDPGDAEALYALGLAELGRGNGKAAVEAFSSARDRRPGFIDARRRLALTLVELGRPDRALEILRTARTDRPKDPEILVDLGWILLRTGAWSEALDRFDDAGSLDHDDPAIHFGRGVALLRLGRREEAEKGLRLQVERPPFRLEQVRQLHRVLRANGTIVREVQFLRRELARRARDSGVLSSLASALLGAGRPEEALEAASELTRHDSSSPDGYLLRGRALETLGKFATAGVAYQQAATLDPGLAEAWCRLGLIDLHSGDFGSAARHLAIGHRIGTADPSWSLPSARWLADARRMLELEPLLPRVRTGQEKGANAAETLDLARLLARKEEPGLAARFFRLAWEMGAGTFPEPSDEHAYLGARAVALANFPISEREDWQRLVLGWLEQGLLSAELRNRSVESFLSIELDRWLCDTVLSGFREPKALAEMPEDLRGAWKDTWRRIAEVGSSPGDEPGGSGGGK